MKKSFLMVIVLLSILPLMSAASLNVQQKTNDVAMIVGLDMPAIFDMQITNIGSGDYFMFYNYFGESMFPKGTVGIARR